MGIGAPRYPYFRGVRYVPSGPSSPKQVETGLPQRHPQRPALSLSVLPSVLHCSHTPRGASCRNPSTDFWIPSRPRGVQIDCYCRAGSRMHSRKGCSNTDRLLEHIHKFSPLSVSSEAVAALVSAEPSAPHFCLP